MLMCGGSLHAWKPITHVFLDANPRTKKLFHEATHNYMTEYDFLHMASPDRHWTLKFWCIEDTDRKLTSWRCRYLTVVLHKDVLLQLWPLQCKARNFASRKKRVQGWDAAAAQAVTQDAQPGEDDVLQDDVSDEELPTHDEVAEEEEERAAQLLEMLVQANVAEGVPLEDIFAADLQAEPVQSIAEGDLQVHEAASTARASTDPMPDQIATTTSAPMETSLPVVVPVAAPSEVPSPAGRSTAIRGVSSTAAATWIGPNGRISFYLSKQAFEAVCTNPSHSFPGHRCVLTRGNKSKAVKGARRAGGRPLGFLVAWLKSSTCFPTKADHRNVANMQFSLADRQAGRGHLMTSAVGVALAAYERAHDENIDGADLEPASLAGYL
eukprot:6485336-Amphidinium_carterae.1